MKMEQKNVITLLFPMIWTADFIILLVFVACFIAAIIYALVDESKREIDP